MCKSHWSLQGQRKYLIGVSANGLNWVSSSYWKIISVHEIHKYCNFTICSASNCLKWDLNKSGGPLLSFICHQHKRIDIAFWGVITFCWFPVCYTNISGCTFCEKKKKSLWLDVVKKATYSVAAVACVRCGSVAGEIALSLMETHWVQRGKCCGLYDMNPLDRIHHAIRKKKSSNNKKVHPNLSSWTMVLHRL